MKKIKSKLKGKKSKLSLKRARDRRYFVQCHYTCQRLASAFRNVHTHTQVMVELMTVIRRLYIVSDVCMYVCTYIYRIFLFNQRLGQVINSVICRDLRDRLGVSQVFASVHAQSASTAAESVSLRSKFTSVTNLAKEFVLVSVGIGRVQHLVAQT